MDTTTVPNGHDTDYDVVARIREMNDALNPEMPSTHRRHTHQSDEPKATPKAETETEEPKDGRVRDEPGVSYNPDGSINE